MANSTDLPFLSDAMKQSDAMASAALQGVALPKAPRASRTKLGINATTGEVWVNGFKFASNNATDALASEAHAAAPSRNKAMPQGFAPLSPALYTKYVQDIKDPSLGTIASKGFGSGIDNLQMTGGLLAEYAGKVVGSKGLASFGAGVVKQNVADLRANLPYQREFTNIKGVGDAGKWFVANAASLAPIVLETLITAGVGAATGGAALTADVIGNVAVNKATRIAVRDILLKKAEGKAVSEAEKKVLLAVGRKAGGAVASAANAYGLSVADIYREMKTKGKVDLGAVALGAVPYAATMLAPELLGYLRVAKSLREGIQSGNRLKRAVKTAASGAAVGGAAMAAQTGVLLGITGNLDLTKPEVQSRFVNAIAAGAGIGAPLGAFAGAVGKTAAAPLTKVQKAADVRARMAAQITAAGEAPQNAAPQATPIDLLLKKATPPTAAADRAQPQTAPTSADITARAEAAKAHADAVDVLMGNGQPDAAGQAPNAMQLALAAARDKVAAKQQEAEHAAALQQQAQTARNEALYQGLPANEKAAAAAIPAFESPLINRPQGPTIKAPTIKAPTIKAPTIKAPTIDLPFVPKQQAPEQITLQQRYTPGVSPEVLKAKLPEVIATVTETPQAAWERLRPQFSRPWGAFANTGEGAAFKAAWTKLTDNVAAGKAEFSLDHVDAMYTDLARPIDRVHEGISIIEDAQRNGDMAAIKDGARLLVGDGMFNTEAAAHKATSDFPGETAAQTAADTINNTSWTPEERAHINDTVLEYASEYPKLQARTKGKDRPWYAYAKINELLEAIKLSGVAVVGELKPRKVSDVAVADIIDTVEHKQQNTQKLITRLDKVLNKEPGSYIVKRNSELAQRLEALYQNSNQSALAGEARLSDYFDKAGKLRLKEQSDGALLPSYGDNKRAAARDASPRKIAGAYDKPTDTGKFMRADGTEIKKPMARGRVKLLVKNMLRKFKSTFKVHVYRNKAELKAQDPALYDEAAAARMNGDFAAVDAMGYAFNDKIIMFSDTLRTKRQVALTLMHEALGHYGLHAITDKAGRARLLDELYATDPEIARATDAALIADGTLIKHDAIEESFADYAAGISVPSLQRIWAVVKDFANKLGLSFQDDMARFMVRQIKRYTRTGEASGFSASHFLTAMSDLQREGMSGRFAKATDEIRIFTPTYGFNTEAGLGSIRKAFAENNVGKFALSKADHYKDTVARGIKYLQTLDNRALTSEGLQEISKLFGAQKRHSAALVSAYNMTTKVAHAPGVTDTMKKEVGQLLAYTALHKAGKVTEKLLRALPPLMEVTAQGEYSPSQKGIDAASKAGEVRRADLTNGVVTFGNTTRPAFSITDTHWKVFLAEREAVNQSAIDLLRSKFEGVTDQKVDIVKEFATQNHPKNGPFSPSELEAIRELGQLYHELYTRNSSSEHAAFKPDHTAIVAADSFAREVSRAVWEGLKLAEWRTGKDANAAVEALRADKVAQKALPLLEKLAQKGLTEEQGNAMRTVLSELNMMDTKLVNAEFRAKQTISSAYVPFERRGKYQVRLHVEDTNGKPITLAPNVADSMPHFQVDDRAVAAELMGKLGAEFGGKTWTLTNVTGDQVAVKLVPQFSDAPTTPSLTESINYDDFVNTLQRFGVPLTPQQREKIVVMLARSHSTARRNLMRSGNPGWDTNVIRNVSSYLETQANHAARNKFHYKLAGVLTDRRKWFGNEQKLASLRKAIDAAKTPLAAREARREYAKYAHIYRHSAPISADNVTVNIGGKDLPILGQGNRALEYAKRTMRWYSNMADISNTPEDLLSSKYGSKAKFSMSIVQLGGSVATAAINLSSVLLNTIPYLSTRNELTGYGGGFGVSDSSAAVFKALSDLKNWRFGSAEGMKAMAKLPATELKRRYGVAPEEFAALNTMTNEGILDAAQMNALLGSARGGVTNNKALVGVKAWMSMFSYTEQLNRRATALAAIRLETARQTHLGRPKAVVRQKAYDFAVDAITYSQGEYAAYNRPELARGNILQYVFMYKQYPIISLELLHNMDPRSRVMYLGALFLLSGLKGLPFASNMADIVDTLAQKSGVKMHDVEAATSSLVDTVAPGMSPIVMRGILDYVFGATFSSRFSLGDLVPLTGAAKYGADPWRQAVNFAGPVASGISAAWATVGNVAELGAQATGLKPKTETYGSQIQTILRESPISALRALTDSYTYLADGTITNSRGRVLSRNATVMDAFSRALGFYPALATRQNDIVRMSKDAAAYDKAIKAAFVNGYIKAGVAGDRQGMRDIAHAVRKWNSNARGTSFYIKNFDRLANRALSAARKPTLQRYLKTTARGVSRTDTQALADLYGVGNN